MMDDVFSEQLKREREKEDEGAVEYKAGHQLRSSVARCGEAERGAFCLGPVHHPLYSAGGRRLSLEMVE